MRFAFVACAIAVLACARESNLAERNGGAKYTALANQSLSVSRSSGRETRMLSVGELRAGAQVVQIGAVGDGTLSIDLRDSRNGMATAIALAPRLCRWADSTRHWLATPLTGPAGATLREASSIMNSDAREIGYRFEVSRSRAADSIAYEALLIAPGISTPASVRLDGLRRNELDAFLTGICAAADSSRSIATRK